MVYPLRKASILLKKSPAASASEQKKTPYSKIETGFFIISI
jgi:hypothetical protein